MRAVDLIRHKRDGGALSRAQIDFFVAGLSHGTLPVKYLLNTHHHTDHAGGNESFGLAHIGWDKTVSTVAFTGGLSGYYDEMKAQLGK